MNTVRAGRGRSRFVMLGSDRDFRLLWVGQATSQLGSAVSGVAMPLLVLALTRSTVLAGLAGTVSFLVTWLAPVPAGVLADRVDRRRLMVGSDLVRALCAAAVAGAALAGAAPAWLLLGCVAVSTSAWMVFGPAEAHAVRAVVPPDRVPEAVAVNQVRTYTAGIVGPAVGGVLFAWGRAVPFLVDLASFAVSVGCVLAIRTALRPEAPPAAGERTFLGAVRRGAVVMWRDGFLRVTTLYSTAMNFVTSTLLYVLVLGAGSRPGGAVVVGVGMSLASVTGIAGSFAAPVLGRRLGARGVLAGVALARAAAMLAVAAVGHPVALVVAVAFSTLLSPVLNTVLAAERMLRVPAEVFGRVLGFTSFVGGALQPLTPLAAGLLLRLAGLPTVLVVLGAGCAVVAAVALRVPPAIAPPVGAEPAGVHRPG